MSYRHFLSWKSLFYELLLPALRRLGPSRGDAVLGVIGRLTAAAWPLRNRQLAAALDRARDALGSGWNSAGLRGQLAANVARFQARDYLLDLPGDEQVLSRFDVDGYDSLRAVQEAGQGVILLGSHLGAHLAGLHWLYRRGVPLRVLVQRPWHVSGELNRRFDRDGLHPQSGFFLRRDLPPGQCVERLLRARLALRDGLAVYLTGDIPWTGPNARAGRLLGISHRFLSVWADLSALTHTPVFQISCSHRPGGRYAISIEPIGTIAPGAENEAVARYLSRLETQIAADPTDAVAHLLWPCYGPPSHAPATAFRRSRRSATSHA